MQESDAESWDFADTLIIIIIFICIAIVIIIKNQDWLKKQRKVGFYINEGGEERFGRLINHGNDSWDRPKECGVYSTPNLRVTKLLIKFQDAEKGPLSKPVHREYRVPMAPSDIFSRPFLSREFIKRRGDLIPTVFLNLVEVNMTFGERKALVRRSSPMGVTFKWVLGLLVLLAIPSLGVTGLIALVAFVQWYRSNEKDVRKVPEWWLFPAIVPGTSIPMADVALDRTPDKIVRRPKVSAVVQGQEPDLESTVQRSLTTEEKEVMVCVEGPEGEEERKRMTYAEIDSLHIYHPELRIVDIDIFDDEGMTMTRHRRFSNYMEAVSLRREALGLVHELLKDKIRGAQLTKYLREQVAERDVWLVRRTEEMLDAQKRISQQAFESSKAHSLSIATLYEHSVGISDPDGLRAVVTASRSEPQPGTDLARIIEDQKERLRKDIREKRNLESEANDEKEKGYRKV